MAHVNFVTILASLAVLTVGEYAMFQSALFRHQNGIFSIGNFSRDANCQLVVESIVSFLTEGPVDCTFRCIGETQCLSFNLAAQPDSDGLYRCELLATDKYRARELDFQASDVFHHYSPWSICQPKDCQNGSCVPDFQMNTYYCLCQPGFAGDRCQRKGNSCSEIKYHSPQATSGSYVIDPDGDGGYQPFTVFCNMAVKTGVGVTVIGHDSEDRMHVTGYEPIGSYSRDVYYLGEGITNVPQIAFLTNVSTHCEQFIKYECRGSLIFRGDTAWWMSRTLTKMTYWGGATPADHNKCACGVTSPNSCADPSQGCNCDKSNGTWDEDSGLLTEKSHLPVLQLRFGDTGASNEEGYHTLGKFKCYGMK